jgi:hypothetical protein
MLKQLRYFFTFLLLAVANVGFADEVTWDLSTNSYASASEDLVLWTSDYASMQATKGSTTNANNYLGGDANSRTSSRFYKGSTLTITPESGYTISSVVFTATNANYATALQTSKWTNATAKIDGTTVTVTPIDGTEPIIAAIGGTTGHTSVVVTYEVNGGPTLKPAELSFETTEFTVAPNADFTAPTLVNPNNLTVTYSSNNEDIAVVDENTGEVVIGEDEGTVTITASFAGNDEYKPGSASYTITVKDPYAKGSENNPYSVAEALAVIDGLADGAKTPTNVYIKGIISEIVEVSPFNESTNTGYGNATYWLSDDGTTNGVQAFRGFYLDNAKFTATDQIQVGDEVVVVGQLQRYVKNGTMTPEVAQNNYIYSIVKSGKPSADLSFVPTEISVELGDDFTEPTLNNPYGVAVTYSSSNTDVAEVAADGKLSIYGAGTATITATFAGNDSYAAGEASYTITVVDPDAPGASIDNPYTVAQAIAFIETLGTSTSSEVYVKGIISQIDEVSTQHGNATYWISDDGGTTTQMEVYRGKYLEGENFTSADQIAVGDEVIVYGTLKKYNETPEFNQGNHLVDLKHNDVPVLADAELSYPVEAYTATIDGENEFPVLANPNELAVTYTSSDESVATVDAEGNITLVGAGETTITATSEETDAFKAGEASYVLTVEEKPEPIEPGTDKYELVTDASTLAAGDEIIIAYVNTNEEAIVAQALGAEQATNNRPAVEVVYNEDATLTPNSTAQVITLESDADGWYFNVGDSYLYAASTSKNWLRTEAEADDNAKATISIDENGATIVFQGTNTRNTMRYNPNNGNPIFSCYASTSSTGSLPLIYRKIAQVEEETIPVTIGSTGYATLYYSEKALEIPEGVTASIVTGVDNTSKNVTFEELDGTIPANTGVVLQGEPKDYDFKVVNVDLAAPDNNMLKGTDEATEITSENNLYILSNGKYGIGFYLDDNNDNHKINNGAHKAYLEVPAGASNAKYFVFGNTEELVSEGDGLVDGINDVNVSESKKEYFNLDGTRANTLRKGIYIVGGKKVVIK